MQLLRPLLLLLIVGGIAAAGYLYVYKKQSPTASNMSSFMSSAESAAGGAESGFKLPALPSNVHFDTASLGTVAQQAQNQLGQLKDRSLEIKEHVGVVLGESQVASDESTLQERAIEYGQYVYCKGVVEEWEKSQAK